nr:immunoglobulin heavy chain junction region [Mus musculus]MBK4195409.1 immunoglobulin heavy chain junction region [Mus musculus]
YYCVRLRRMD